VTPLNIALLSSEIVPFAKTGGLADVAGALLKELGGRGHDIRGFMPLYGQVRRSHPELVKATGQTQGRISIGGIEYSFDLWTAPAKPGQVPVYFVDCPALYDRPALYTLDADEHRRFLFFTRAVIESCPRLHFQPDVFHCNDWHTAMLPLFLKTTYAGDRRLQGARSVLTIHNIGYQGILPASAAADLGTAADRVYEDDGDRASGSINPLKNGIKFADVVTTVSPTYAREISATPLGMGMQETLRARAGGVIGILNGVDYGEWDPRIDRHLAAHFDAQDLSGKALNKQRLIAAAGLGTAPGVPIIGMVTRLAEQKGIDLLFEALPRLLEERIFGFVILGNGDANYTTFFAELARRFAGRAAFHQGHDEAFAHLIEAGSDMFLMPSRYEPCGLNQMYSLRYGTSPIVRNTGGLADSVHHFDPNTGRGTGCVFNDYDAPAVRWAVATTLDWFAHAPTWSRLVHNAMLEDFSWARQTARYEQVYRDALAVAAV
jgi:starch synthase